MTHGFTCVGVVQASNYTLPGNSSSIECDLTDAKAVDKLIHTLQPDYIVHLAAISFVAHGSTRDVYVTNVVATLNVLDAAAKHCPSIKKILVASSGNVYGNALSLPVTEQATFAPTNDYAVSKAAMEYAVSLRMGQLPIVITRPFNYTGLGQAEYFLIPKIVAAYKRKQPTLELGNLDVARDFSDVRDIARAYRQLLQVDITSEVFNLCSGKPVSLSEILLLAQSITGHHIDIKVNPTFLRANEVKELFGSEAKLVTAIGAYRKISSVKETLEWMLNYP